MNKTYKLGSLFDGSGGFPLAGALCGIEPVWASEVEPYPIAVTKTRFPDMKHFGDISKINGAEIEPVDIITFGSPCQDLSVAGKRAGLKHEDNGDDETTRSGLFIEAVRIIKEMREKTNGEYPRFAVWENVPGAFSSNKGEDFRIVLEELVKVAEPTAVMPPVPQFGWAYADSYCGNGWSLAYRVLDAQYWGVPQRRRRIYLVADFRGGCAREILFEREGLRGYFTQGRTPWKAVTPDVERGIGADDREGESNCLTPWDVQSRRIFSADGSWPSLYGGEGGGHGYAAIPYTLKIRSGVSVDSYGKAAGKGALIQKNKSATLGVSQDQYLFQPVGVDVYNTTVTGDVACPLTAEGHTSTGTCPKVMVPVAYGISAYESNAMKSSNPHSGVYEADTSRTLDLNGGNPACNQGGIAIVDTIGGQAERGWEGDIAPTLKATHYKNPPSIAYGVDAYNQALTGDKAKTLNSAASDADHVPCAVYSVENHPADSRVNIDDSGKVQTLTSRMGTGGGNVPMVMETVALEGNGQRPSHRGDGYAETDKSYTLNATEVHGVAYSFDLGASRDVGVLFIEECGKTLTNGTCPGHHDGVVIATQPTPLTASKASFFMNADENIASTLVATDYKDPQLVCYEDEPIAIDRAYFNQGQNALYDPQTYEDGTTPTLVARGPSAVATRYIVRRLTPTECARLQGFADRWGDIEPKTEFSDEEYRFWLEVRHTYEVVIKGKDPKDLKDYNHKQMLTWYNKLPVDSAEYKMWGNGIALPTALYVIQGIADAMKGETT